MKKLILALMLVSSQALAVEPFEVEMTLECGDSKNFLTNLHEEFKEELLFMSPSRNEQGDELAHSLLVNLQDQTWTFIVTNRQKGASCILASGTGVKFFQPSGTGI